MAILKHIASKNANYGSAIDYLKYQHDEFHLVPVLDERGNMLLREEFYLDGLNCHPETFDLECELLNQQYHKNNTYDEIKSHHYIISHDPRDNADHDLTGERAQAIGLEYAKANFPGHQALVCTHTDGNNGTGNIHTHIIINSLRKFDVDPQPFTERPIDCRAGYKHHLTKDYLKHLQKSLMDICQREGLHQVDLLSPAADKITQQEYHAQRRGQLNLDIANMELLGDGITPMHTTFETNKEKIRNAISDIAERATSFEEFQRLLKAEYGILVKDHRGRFSYLPADRQKFISARALGSNYDRDRLLRIFAENARNREQNNPHWTVNDPLAILFIKSDLRLVVDLQTCVKAQQSRAYAQKVKIQISSSMTGSLSVSFSAVSFAESSCSGFSAAVADFCSPVRRFSSTRPSLVIFWTILSLPRNFLSAMKITSFRLEPSCEQGCVVFPLIKHLLQLPGKGDQTGVYFLTVKITVGFHVKAVSQFIGQCANGVKVFQHRMHHRFFIVEVERLHLIERRAGITFVQLHVRMMMNLAAQSVKNVRCVHASFFSLYFPISMGFVVIRLYSFSEVSNLSLNGIIVLP